MDISGTATFPFAFGKTCGKTQRFLGLPSCPWSIQRLVKIEGFPCFKHIAAKRPCHAAITWFDSGRDQFGGLEVAKGNEVIMRLVILVRCPIQPWKDTAFHEPFTARRMKAQIVPRGWMWHVEGPRLDNLSDLEFELKDVESVALSNSKMEQQNDRCVDLKILGHFQKKAIWQIYRLLSTCDLWEK